MNSTKELRYQIQMTRSQEDLDKIIRRNKSAIHEHSFMKFVVENQRRIIRHVEHAQLICNSYLQN